MVVHVGRKCPNRLVREVTGLSVSKYFDSKSALLEVGLERHLAAVAEIDGQLGLRRVGDLHSMFVTAR